METKMVAIQVPKIVMQTKWIQEPREISIPRQIIEKRVIKKLVPKMVEVEEEYEYEVGLTEEEYIEVPHTETRQIEYEDVEVEYEKVPVGMQQSVYASNSGMSAGVAAAMQQQMSLQQSMQYQQNQQSMPYQQNYSTNSQQNSSTLGVGAPKNYI